MTTYRAVEVSMRAVERMQNIQGLNSLGASDPLKGLLMDKGPDASHGQLYFLLSKIRVCKAAIKNLCIHHNQVMAKNYGCNYLALHYFESASERTGTGHCNPFMDQALVEVELKATCYAHWLIRAGAVRATQGALRNSHKAFPFTPAHHSHVLLRALLLTNAPHYYEAIAAVDNVRLTLNTLYGTLKYCTQNVMAANADADHTGPMSLFTAQNRRESEALYAQFDPEGELQALMESLFKGR